MRRLRILWDPGKFCGIAGYAGKWWEIAGYLWVSYDITGYRGRYDRFCVILRDPEEFQEPGGTTPAHLGLLGHLGILLSVCVLALLRAHGIS